MNYLFTIAFRNLFRQKRRNILLGTAIAFGTAILILANSFAHGISDILFNQIIVYVAGHISVGFTQNGNVRSQVFHDGARMYDIVKKTVPDITQIQEAIGIFARAIGNGKSDNVIMVGMDLDTKVTKKEKEEYKKNFKIVEGSIDDLKSTLYEHPVALAADKAKYLNVKLHDNLKVRFSDINGQQQAANLTIVTIMKPANLFMSAPIFLEIKDLKKLAGYGPNDVAQMYIRIKDAKKNAKGYADKLHSALKSSVAAIGGTTTRANVTEPVLLMSMRTDSTSYSLIKSKLTIISSIDTGISKSSVVLSSSLASSLKVKAGDTCNVTFKSKYDSLPTTWPLIITHVAEGKGLNNNMLLVNDKEFMKMFNSHWPEPVNAKYNIPTSSNPLYSALSPEWYLIDRAKTTQDVKKRYQEIAQKRYKGATVDVGSMYETASAVLNLEKALNMITFVAVMLLFFIILIGVINTLRMTIRERTREIGTIRAIGMQKNDVRNSFLLESGFLAFMSSLVGAGLAFLTMAGLSQIKIDASDNPMGMLLDNSHLHFAPTLGATIFFIVFIIAMAVVTAWFPARKAAGLSAAEALRHFD